MQLLGNIAYLAALGYHPSTYPDYVERARHHFSTRHLREPLPSHLEYEEYPRPPFVRDVEGRLTPDDF